MCIWYFIMWARNGQGWKRVGLAIQDGSFGRGAGSRSRGSGLWVSYPTDLNTSVNNIV